LRFGDHLDCIGYSLICVPQLPNEFDRSTEIRWPRIGKPVTRGINLANMELKIVTAALLKLYRVRAGVDMTSDDMEMTDHFLLVPKGGKCNLVFEKMKE